MTRQILHFKLSGCTAMLDRLRLHLVAAVRRPLQRKHQTCAVDSNITADRDHADRLLTVYSQPSTAGTNQPVPACRTSAGLPGYSHHIVYTAHLSDLSAGLAHLLPGPQLQALSDLHVAVSAMK